MVVSTNSSVSDTNNKLPGSHYILLFIIRVLQTL